MLRRLVCNRIIAGIYSKMKFNKNVDNAMKLIIIDITIKDWLWLDLTTFSTNVYQLRYKWSDYRFELFDKILIKSFDCAIDD